MIRSFLLEHEIEAQVLHENAGNLWAGAVAACLLSVHETDLEFLNDAFSAPSESLTDDSPIPECDCPELDSPPLRFGPLFFLSVAVTGTVLAWTLALLSLLLLFVNALPELATNSNDPVLHIEPRAVLTGIAALSLAGFVGGLLWAVAILGGRLFQPDGHGKLPFGARCVIFVVACLYQGIAFPIQLFFFSSYLVPRPISRDGHHEIEN